MKTNFVLAFIFLLISANSCKTQQMTPEKTTTNIVVDGKNFFPIGIYNNSVAIFENETDNQLNLLTDAGFNLFATGGFPTEGADIPRYLSFMDNCKSRGINVLIGPSDSREAVDLYKDHPALFGWTIWDDVNRSDTKRSDVVNTNNQNKLWDDKHYTYIAALPKYGDAQDPTLFFGTSDLKGFEMYPIDSWAQNPDNNPVNPFPKSEELYQNERDCAALQAGNKEDKPWLAIPQAFSWANYLDGVPTSTAKFPTPEEFRNIVYVSLINGAKGVIYYEWQQDGKLIRPGYVALPYKLWKNNILWTEVKKVNAELKVLQDVFMLGKRIKIEKDDWNTISYWAYNNETYIIIANTHKTEAQPVDYYIGADGQMSNVFSNRIASLSYNANTKKIVGTIPAVSTQVYKIK